ncbi:MAG: DUF2461 domain-containing protein [Candidatus Neomarinimicrobiota bacterium]|jgi:uncharacterized protein (TIGR02453 family)|nr:DUF2461 domain-containing protein [Candidatus Neomarinimicrobiota bacterium]MDD3966576.1 DUF2461 domain-containing protein [Candidatus Neomarinimicrobiota bacterium]MDX9781235.1 DUF2461 domain-containing protein [bacterium]
MLFNGFSHHAQVFLRDLQKNNNKDWFEAHRDQYENLLLIPLRKLVMDLSACMFEIDPLLELRPLVNKTISRIYRDTRFSRNKDLFRTSMWIAFKRHVAVWQRIPTWFIEISPFEYTYGMGFYEASSGTMARFRKILCEQEARFRELIRPLPGDPPLLAEGCFYKRKNATTDLPEELREWYMRRNLYLICHRPPGEPFYSDALVPHLERRFRELAPLYYLLMEISADEG